MSLNSAPGPDIDAFEALDFDDDVAVFEEVFRQVRFTLLTPLISDKLLLLLVLLLLV